jgi:hypothetical protein
MRGPKVFCLGRKRTPGLDGKDLRLLVVEPGTLGEAASDDGLRRDGRMTSPPRLVSRGWYLVDASDLTLVLTEFADPEAHLSGAFPCDPVRASLQQE